MGAYDSIDKIKSSGFDVGLNRLREDLRGILNKHWPAEMFSDFERRCAKFLDKDCVISEGKILRCWNRGELSCGSVELKERFFYAVLYCLGAEKEYNKGCDDTAGLLAMRSALELGRFDGWRQCMAVINIAYKGRLKGGEAGKAIREDAYRELLDYVKSGPVKKSKKWAIHEDVVRDYEERLQGFMDYKYPLFPFKADNFIDKSLGQKGEVKNAYLTHKKAE